VVLRGWTKVNGARPGAVADAAHGVRQRAKLRYSGAIGPNGNPNRQQVWSIC
jgi:hypothetical protein